MAKKIFIVPLSLLLLSSCASNGGASSYDDQPDGGMVTFTASSLPKIPEKKEKEVTISGHVFTYYNVYNDGEGNFVLLDDTSYIRNYDIYFGLLFDAGLARAYDISGGKEGYDLCEDYQVSETQQSYSVYGGFEIAIDKTMSSHHCDENIGKIVHWC